MNNFGLFCRALEKNGSFGFFERWLVCRKKPNVPFAGRLFTLSDNVVALGEGGEIEEQMFNLVQMFNRILMLKFSTKAPLLPNACWR